MKSRLLLLIPALLMGFLAAKAQNVNIPDSNFKAYLLGNTSINTNSDTEIQVTEAQAFTGIINCNNRNISDLTGIEAFTSMIGLWCPNNNISSISLSSNPALESLNLSNNQLTSLDVSSNPNLLSLNCSGNLLTSIDLSNNASMVSLDCYSNQLTSLDVSGITDLVELGCYTNQLTTLDVSNNLALKKLICMVNQLQTLDVSNNDSLIHLQCNVNVLTSLNVANGNNTNFITFDAASNANLGCIEVDDANYSTANWTGSGFNFDNGVVFSEDCQSLVSISENPLVNSLAVYPNPASDFLSIRTSQPSVITISNALGQTVQTLKIEDSATIDVREFEQGIYYLTHLATMTSVKFICF